MNSDQTAAESGEDGAEPIPQDVATAARLWAKDKFLEEPANAAWLNHFVWTTLRKTAFVAVLLALFVLAVIQMRHLIGMLIIATFFALAIIPGVNSLTKRFGMRRGAAVAIIYAIAAVTLTILVLVIIPAIVTFADAVQTELAAWISSLDDTLSDLIGSGLSDPDAVHAATDQFLDRLSDWGSSVFGVVTSGIGFIFDFFTILAFTFYIAADFPRIRRAVMTRMTPERQHVFAWITDTSIEQTGGYFYSRLLLMLVNGSLGFGVMVLLGLPLVYAVPMALFMGFVSEFIPMIGTYIGAIIPILLILAVQGPVAAALFGVWVIIYQQIENYWLSPRFSSQTMELSGAIAFGAALAGGAIAGPMGAFMALPVAALITAIVNNAGRTYAVVVDDLEGPTLGDDVANEFTADGHHISTAGKHEHPRWQFWRRG